MFQLSSEPTRESILNVFPNHLLQPPLQNYQCDSFLRWIREDECNGSAYCTDSFLCDQMIWHCCTYPGDLDWTEKKMTLCFLLFTLIQFSAMDQKNRARTFSVVFCIKPDIHRYLYLYKCISFTVSVRVPMSAFAVTPLVWPEEHSNCSPVTLTPSERWHHTTLSLLLHPPVLHW